MAVDLEQFCKAIDIIVSERLSDLSFDTTMICTIVDDNDKDRGHYIVSDGTIRFDAYTNDTSYKENDQVRVSVLNGNFNERKFIEGPYIGDSSGAPVTYISPLGTALSLEENMLTSMGSPQNISSFQIHTNTEDEILIWEVDISNDSKYQTLQENGIYNTLTLSADFMTNLGNLSQGNYGLVLDLFIKKSKDDNTYDHKYITFDSSEMIGNPYSFEIYSHQEKKINLVSFGMISMIRLSAYEGVYFDNTGRLNDHRIENPFVDMNGNILGKIPINIRNIKLGIGNDLISVTDNALQLYTTSSIYYNYYEPTDETNNKTLGLIWLNKTETNEYIGYSDGVYDLNYDEITYRKKSYQDSRLVAQMEKVGIANDRESLTLAADIAEAEPHMIKAYELLTTDLSQVLQALSRQLTGAPAILEHLNKLIKNWDSGSNDANGNTIMNAPLLNTYKYNAQQATQKLIQFYSQILNYGYNVQNQITPNDWNKKAKDTRELSSSYNNEQTFYINENDALVKKNHFSGVVNWDYSGYYNDFITNINSGIQAVKDFFAQMTTMTASGEVLNGYAGIRDTYNSRAEAVISLIQDYLKQISDLCEGDVAALQNYKNKQNYTSYSSEASSEELALDNNKYCIYWYQYQPGFALEYDSAEGANNTEYLHGNFAGVNWKRIPELDNVGLPQSAQASPSQDGKYYYIAQPNEEEYTTSIYLDPATQEEKIKVIMFYNHELITSNIIEFENRDAVPEDKIVDAMDTLRIEHDIDSQDHYQIYSAAYDLVNVSDGSKMRQLKCFYNGILSGDETLIDSWLYWYIPTNATLLTYDKDYLVNTLGFSTDADGKTEYSLDNYIYFAKKVVADDSSSEEELKIDDVSRTFVYKIKSFYEPAATNNTILVKAIIPGYTQTINGNKDFTFSTFGNSGTKYTFSIVPGDNRVGYSSDNGEYWQRGLNLNMSLKDADNNSIKMITEVPSDGSNEIGSNLTVDFIAPSTRILSRENYNEITNSLDWNISLNDPSWDTNETVKNFIGVLQATVFLYNDATKGNVNLSTLYAIPYSANPQYYISGPTVIVYNNQGTVSRVSEEPFKLFEHTVNGDKAIENTSWKIEYYTSDGDLISIGEDEISQKNIYAYMPKLNMDNTLTPAPMYFTYETENAYGNSQEYYPVAKCYSNNNTLLWSQPIIITQNKYASAMLNNWDGSFAIDEANGTLMATMLGAGKKTKENTFEGVLIGDITAGDGFDPNNASGIGIYGFNDGAQSYNLGVDGRVFFGKSGRGRIYFDGNQGTIASASYLQNKDGSYADYKTPIEDENGNIVGYDIYNSSGMLIDLDDGFIDIKGTTYADDAGSSYLDKHELYTQEEWEALPSDSKFKFTPIYSELEWNRLDNKQHNSYDDYISLTQPTRLTDYDSYVAAYDVDDIYIKSYKQSHIHIDAKSPYLIIHSGQQFNEDKHLMEISDSDYYLQTDDYKQTTFQTPDRGAPFTEAEGPGAGFKLDLKNSLLDAYNLKITSKNLFINSTGDGKPYFVIKSDYSETENESYRNLMYVDDETYYLQSVDFKPKDDEGYMGSGMKLTMRGIKPGIEAYNFTLRSGNTGAGDHRIILQDTSPYFIVNTNGNTTENPISKSLAVIGDNEFYFQSADYLSEEKDSDGNITQRGVGMRLSLSGKELKAYSGFTLKAFKPTAEGSSNSHILIDATAAAYPLKVYGSDEKYFQVNWDGGMYATGADITGTINATGGNFTGTITVGGTIRGGTIIGSSMFAKTLDIGGYDANSNPTAGTGNFHVNQDGSFVATEGTIGGWKVTAGSGFSSGTGASSVYVNPDGMGYGNKKFYVDAEGNLFATSAVFDKSLAVKASRGAEKNVMFVDASGNVALEGYIAVKGKIYSASKTDVNYIYLGATTHGTNGILMYGDDVGLYSDQIWIGNEGKNTYINGKLKVNANTGIATDSDSKYALKVGGKTYITGHIGIGVEPNDTYNLRTEGKIEAGGDFYYTKDIYCGTGTNAKKGVDGTVAVDGKGLFSGGIYLTFKNGILISTDKPSGEGATVTTSNVPTFSSSDKNKYLQVGSTGTTLQWSTAYPPLTTATVSGQFLMASDTKGGSSWQTIYVPKTIGDGGTVWSSKYEGSSSGNTAGWNSIPSLLGATTNDNRALVSTGSTSGASVAWKKLGALAFADDIKKKFNMTLSGTVKKANHSYYVLDSATGGSYTPIGQKVEGTNLGRPITRCKRGAKLNVYTFTSNSDIYYNGTNCGKSVKGIKCNYAKYEYGEDVTVYEAGSSYTLYKAGTAQTYPTYKKAGNLSVSVTASQDVTLVPTTDDETTTSISISATGGTATVSG